MRSRYYTLLPHNSSCFRQLHHKNPLPEDSLVTDVSDRVTGILKRMEKELDAADEQIKNNLKVLKRRHITWGGDLCLGSRASLLMYPYTDALVKFNPDS